MSGAALQNSSPRRKPVPTTASPSLSPHRLAKKQSAAEIDAETARLKAMVEREDREQREAKELERKLREEAEILRREREAEVARETERLRRLYGTHGQDFTLPPPPALPPRPGSTGPSPGRTPVAGKASQYQQHFSQHPQQPFSEPAAAGSGSGSGSHSSHASKLATKFEQHMPLTNQAVSTVSGMLRNKIKKDRDKDRDRDDKKRSV